MLGYSCIFTKQENQCKNESSLGQLNKWEIHSFYKYQSKPFRDCKFLKDILFTVVTKSECLRRLSSGSMQEVVVYEKIVKLHSEAQ